MSLMKAKASQEAKQDGPSSAGYQPCRHCHGSTPIAMLSQYGGLCHTCYGGWTQVSQPGPIVPLTRDEKLGILHRLRGLVKPQQKTRAEIWAPLQAKADRGEELTVTQREMLEAGTRGLRPQQHDAWPEDEAA